MKKLTVKILRKLGIKFCFYCDKPLSKPYIWIRITEESWEEGLVGHEVPVCEECKNQYFKDEDE